MTLGAVSPAQRFTRAQPCPICTGFEGTRRGKGVRCHGFFSSDRRVAHCTREEYAGGIQRSEANTHAHAMGGACRCGVEHAIQPIQETARGRAPDFSRCTPPYPCDYLGETGETLYRVARWTRGDGTKTYAQFHPAADGGWVKGRGSSPRTIYRSPEIQAAIKRGDVVHVVEGEKKVWILERFGMFATTNDAGAGNWSPAHTSALSGARLVVIWSDQDAPGRTHALAVAAALREAAIPEIRLPALPDLAEGQGLDDWIARLSTTYTDAEIRAELDRAIWAAAPFSPAIRTEAGPGPQGRLQITRLIDVRPQQVRWLWPARIPLGMLTIFDGDPGLGKSTLLFDIAARVSRGDDMPDGQGGRGPAGVVILSAEDDLARVILPRLIIARADLNRIAILQIRENDGELRDPTLCRADLRDVEHAIGSVGAELVIVDPLVAYLPADVNAYRDQDIRRALTPLRALTERTGVAVVAIRHLNKRQGGNPLYRGGGSIGIVAAARAGLLLAPDPDDATGDTRVLAVKKSNLARKAPSLKMRLVADPGEEHPRVCWEGTSQHTAATLLEVPQDAEAQSVLDDAIEFLRDLTSQGPVPAQEVRRAGAKAGFPMITIYRAKKRLGVDSQKLGRPGEKQSWCWMPPKMINEFTHEHLRAATTDNGLSGLTNPEGDQSSSDDHLRPEIGATDVADLAVASTTVASEVRND